MRCKPVCLVQILSFDEMETALFIYFSIEYVQLQLRILRQNECSVYCWECHLWVEREVEVDERQAGLVVPGDLRVQQLARRQPRHDAQRLAAPLGFYGKQNTFSFM